MTNSNGMQRFDKIGEWTLLLVAMVIPVTTVLSMV